VVEKGGIQAIGPDGVRSPRTYHSARSGRGVYHALDAHDFGAADGAGASRRAL